jgi:uncharacterized protein (TIGR03067 family)
MRSRFRNWAVMFALVTVCCLSATTTGKDDPKKGAPNAADEELSRLRGRWKVVAAEEDGKEVSEDARGETEFNLDGEQGKAIRKGKTLDFKIKLNPSMNPKQMDIVSTEVTTVAGSKMPPKTITETVTVRAIYELSDDTLTIARPSFTTGDRPTSFAPEDRKGFAKWTFKRIK